jgi:hypothetical protein
MNKRTSKGRPFVRQIALLLSVAGLVILAVLLLPKKEKAAMLPTARTADKAAETRPETGTDMPAIDANAPTQTRTATFAMG